MSLLIYALCLGAITATLISFLLRGPLDGLHRIPNAHFTAPYSRFWLLWIRWNGRENRARLELHRRLGPIVRISPREVSINCIDGGVRQVYGPDFAKSAWYPHSFFGVETPYMLTMLGKEEHTARKRMLSTLYTKSHIMNSREIDHCIGTVLDSLHSRMVHWADGGPVDVLEQMRACVMDITSAWLYGRQNGSDFLHDNGERKVFLDAWQQAGEGSFWRGEFYSFTRALEWIGVHLVPLTAKLSLRTVQVWGMEMTTKASKAYTSPFTVDGSLYTHLRTNFKKANPSMPVKDVDRIISAELLDHAIASHDVGGIALTYIMYELSKHPDIQQDLRTEVRGLGKDGSSSKTIDDLPLLDAVLTETLRLHAPSPGPFPRVVPKPGCRLAARYDVPPGTIVSATAYTLHRNADVFPQPEEWRPTRWLTADKSSLLQMRKWFWAFGSGARICVASHFANRIIKALLVEIYTNFETLVHNEDSLDQIDATVSAPVENNLYLSFRSRKVPHRD